MFKYCIERAHWLDLCGKVIQNKDSLIALKSHARLMAEYAIKTSDDATKELGFQPEDYELHELQALKYLKTFTE